MRASANNFFALWVYLPRKPPLWLTLSAVLIARALGAPEAVVTSLAPKSVTAAVAIAISSRLGGDAALTAVMVILTWILGAMVLTPLMTALRITDKRALGVRGRPRGARDRRSPSLSDRHAGRDVCRDRDWF
jgi:membrane protein implicated in regulation of membrane protease activity